MPLLRAASSKEAQGVEEAAGSLAGVNHRAIAAAAADLSASLSSFCAATQEISHLLQGEISRLKSCPSEFSSVQILPRSEFKRKKGGRDDPGCPSSQKPKFAMTCSADGVHLLG